MSRGIMKENMQMDKEMEGADETEVDEMASYVL